jgi:endonuclease/exonuclease/phosphatase (EEP) superfamily protein YafD
VLGVPIAVGSLVGFLDRWLYVASLATSVRLHLLLFALALGVLAIAVRSVVGLGLAAFALLVNAVVLVPLYTNEPAFASGTGRALIAHVNMRHHYGDFDDVRRVLEERKPQVLVILEPSRGWLRKTSPSPVGYRVFIRGTRPEPRIILLASQRVSKVEFPADSRLPRTSVTFDLELDDEPVRVLALHTAAPATARHRRTRDEELEAASSWARERAGSEVVLGDLNATPWSGVLQSLENSAGLRNSAYGYGVQATWPSSAGPLGLPIDQLLHSWDLTVTDRETGPGFGSEHRSLWVTIARAASRRRPPG